jgi:GNAT superfamily N-acetyltransferase
MIIRPMTLADVSAVKELIDSNFPKHVKLESLQHTLHCDTCHTYVMVEGNRVLATVGIRDRYRIAWLAVEDKRQGHGRRLMAWLLYQMRDELRHVYLYVKQSNTAAIHLYQTLGFRITETRPDTYSFKMEMT